MSRKALVEAALFMSENPLSLERLRKVTEIPEGELKSILAELGEELKIDSRGLELAVTGEGYHFKVKDSFAGRVSPLAPHSDLSDGMLRTLGLVALRQPIAQSQVVKIQGNKSYGYIKRLERKGLVVAEKSGKTRVLRTTAEFERYFGKNLTEIQGMVEGKVEARLEG
ncbi:SMC-Scp complex subunit ScpB [Candidatus Micrarchaeota archaeon RBG_16_49_10]|nr:MAG: SMC-Scp complex subunit ScpB [Candidatus Micrarchaeota archaeon RBG_16_49_10]